MRPLSRSPIRPLLLFILTAGLFMLAAATNARAAGEAREGYERVPAVVTVEKAYRSPAYEGPERGGCAVAVFLIWEKLANEDLEKPFFGHYVSNDQDVTQPMVSPFNDEKTGDVWAFSGAPADHHKQALGGMSTAPHPDADVRRDGDCDEIMERRRPVYEADPSRIWVEVPVAERADSAECADARAKVRKLKRKVRRLKRKVRRLERQSGPEAAQKLKETKKKLRRAKRKLRAARRQVRNRC